MSESEEKSVKNKNTSLDETFASHCALQIALQTMKERCQLLQQRLSSVEKENLHLRIERQNNPHKNVGIVINSEGSKLEEKITQLTREKAQLSNCITMVEKENKQLWTRLSRLTEANQSLGNHLTKISDTLNKLPNGEASKSNQSANGSNISEKLQDDSEAKEESLEEISLKIIDRIKREKQELEQQCEQMVELQTGAINVEDCGFTLTTSGDSVVDGVSEEDGESVMDDIRKLREKMKDEYKMLKDQQAGLRAAITVLSGLQNGDKCCQKCKDKVSEEDKRPRKSEVPLKVSEPLALNNLKRPLDEIQKQLNEVSEPPDSSFCNPWAKPNEAFPPKTTNQNQTVDDLVNDRGDDMFVNYEDRICPLCSKFYDRKVPFEKFHEHVVSHFNGEEDENNSIIANFEEAFCPC